MGIGRCLPAFPISCSAAEVWLSGNPQAKEAKMPSVDLNSDLGEGFGTYRCGDDDAMLSIVTSANVACGLHAGDPEVMARTFAIPRERGRAVAAPPPFPRCFAFPPPPPPPLPSPAQPAAP